tara:strand:+ start:63 stop:464 length:402 start_codon:yes stop_codon:yes gene_type:complete
MIDKEILKIASETDNYGFLENHSHYSNSKSSVCGDFIKVYLTIKNKKVLELKYEGNFCIYCNASASLLAKKIKNKSVEETKNFIKNSSNFFKKNKDIKNKEWNEFKKIMNKSNVSRKACLLLPLKTLLKAINN